MTQQDQTDLALDPDLMAYIDGGLPPDQMAEIEARLARDPDAREAVAQWRHFDNLLHQYGRTVDEMPSSLKIASLERELGRKLKKRQWRATLLGPGLQRFAASVVLFAAGWGAHSLYESGMSLTTASHPYFVAPTLAGHSAVTLASYQGTEFKGDQMSEALEWMSEQMQHKIESPKLERLGYQVESSRLMTVQGQPVAVFYYRNPENELVTVSMTPRDPSQPDYRLRVTEAAENKMAYWSSNSLHYVVVAKTDAASLTTLAAAVE